MVDKIEDENISIHILVCMNFVIRTWADTFSILNILMDYKLNSSCLIILKSAIAFLEFFKHLYEVNYEDTSLTR